MNLVHPEETSVTSQLKSLICGEIQAAGGWLPFSRFMELALYTPRLGYYSSDRVKWGRQGDFVTAPEMTPLFARCIAKQFQQILQSISHGDILEVGAGSGVFARDVLLELASMNALPDHYYIYEISAELRARQQALLSAQVATLRTKIIWLEKLPTEQINGVIFANEVMDALPTELFQIENEEIYEQGVGIHQDEFVWQMLPARPEIKQKIEMIFAEQGLPAKYQSEINMALVSWIDSVVSVLNKGVILLFDYGYGRAEYYHPDRSMGTLMCFHQHRKHDNPLVWVGEQDITAHVDFTSVVETAVDAGCQLLGYSTQAAFLLSLGLDDLVAEASQTELARLKNMNEVKKLLLPQEMGELIKVMALGKEITIDLKGFAWGSRSGDL